MNEYSATDQLSVGARRGFTKEAHGLQSVGFVYLLGRQFNCRPDRFR
jgi:hypothetical protein